MNAPNLRITPDVSYRDDMTLKLLGYVQEELSAAKLTDDHVIRMRHLECAQAFMSEALRSFRSDT